MTHRKAPPNLLYSNARSLDWTRALSSLIDDGLVALCIRQWQRAPATIAQHSSTAAVRRRARG